MCDPREFLIKTVRLTESDYMDVIRVRALESVNVCKENEMTQSFLTYDEEDVFEAATNWRLVRLDDDRKIWCT